jgi:hypothetical protein
MNKQTVRAIYSNKLAIAFFETMLNVDGYIAFLR